MNLSNNASMFLKINGKLYKIQAVAKSVDEANKLCDEHSNLGVMSESVEDRLIYLVAMDDYGIPA